VRSFFFSCTCSLEGSLTVSALRKSIMKHMHSAVGDIFVMEKKRSDLARQSPFFIRFLPTANKLLQAPEKHAVLVVSAVIVSYFSSPFALFPSSTPFFLRQGWRVFGVSHFGLSNAKVSRRTQIVGVRGESYNLVHSIMDRHMHVHLTFTAKNVSCFSPFRVACL